jgi:hypothetical protein
MRQLTLALLLLAPMTAGGQPIETAQTLAAARPKAFAAYRAVLPEAYGSAPWAGALDGVSEPLEVVALEGRDYAIGFSCRPHDCGANALSFLAALDGSRAVVMVKSDEFTGGALEVYGRGTPAERTRLKAVLDLPR